ncbi:MAG: PaaI family thioesterase [Pseudomonadota bacterium]
MPEKWTVEEAQHFVDDVFAPWIVALGLRITAVNEGSIDVLMPGNPDTTRGGGPGGGVVCGQAIAAAGDTASVVALSALNETFRPCTTVDLTAHFMRPLPEGDVEITITALSNGRRMATTRAEFRAPGGKLAATATLAFAYLDI